MITYGFIGCGNMGSALIKGAASKVPSDSIYIYDKDTDKAKKVSNDTKTIYTDIITLSKTCKYIFLGVKPQNMEDMLSEIKEELKIRTDRFIIVSMAASTTIESIRKYVGEYPVIRIMPNLPVSVNEGTILYTTSDVTEEEKNEFTELLSNCSTLIELEEKYIDAGSAVSGCGPAFVYKFINALTNGGVKCGLNKEDSILMACKTLIGASKLLLESDKECDELVKAVCSPGGTTIEGVKELDNNEFEKITESAVIKSYERALELKKI